MKEEGKSIWVIGHSTRSLHRFDIELIADIRSYPGSRKFPSFNKESREVFLPQNNIQYVHLKTLGGEKKSKSKFKEYGRHVAFRRYADYMEQMLLRMK